MKRVLLAISLAMAVACSGGEEAPAPDPAPASTPTWFASVQPASSSSLAAQPGSTSRLFHAQVPPAAFLQLYAEMTSCSADNNSTKPEPDQDVRSEHIQNAVNRHNPLG